MKGQCRVEEGGGGVLSTLETGVGNTPNLLSSGAVSVVGMPRIIGQLRAEGLVNHC